MQKSTWLFYGIGVIIGACVGFAVHDLAIGMGRRCGFGDHLCEEISQENPPLVTVKKGASFVKTRKRVL